MTAGGTPASGSTALVVGLGRSGLALARHLAFSGVGVRVSDLRATADVAAAAALLPPGVELRSGVQDESLLDGCDWVFASPGVPWDAPLLRIARERGCQVSSEIDLFLRLCPAEVVGITGTNGKTTTTALTAAVLGRGERPVLVGGNIGDTVLDRLPEVTPEHRVVLELSSFQLESVSATSPQVAVILNLTPDHVDRHGSLGAYFEAKARILDFQSAADHAVLNGADERVRALAGRARGHVVWFDRHRPIPPMPIPGTHNLENALAAAAVGRIAGLPDDVIADAVASFPGVEHRLELVGSWNGIRWYNDSKATNPEAGRRAIAALAGAPMVLIAGGRGGGFELDAWLADVRRGATAVVLIGESAEELAAGLRGHPSLHRAASIEEAVEIAGGLAQPGGSVLLSPAHKSFDMFRDFEERGRCFKTAVHAMHGEG